MTNPIGFLHTLKASFQLRFGRVAFFLASLTILFVLIAILGGAGTALFASTHQTAAMAFLKVIFVIWSLWVAGILVKALLLTIWDGVLVLIRGDGKTL